MADYEVKGKSRVKYEIRSYKQGWTLIMMMGWKRWFSERNIFEGSLTPSRPLVAPSYRFMRKWRVFDMTAR